MRLVLFPMYDKIEEKECVYMNLYLLLCISICFAVANNLLLHGFGNRGLRGMGDVLLFNSFVSLVWLAVLAILNGGAAISVSAWLWGAAYGSVTAAFLLCKMQALSTGPVSITSFIGCSSLILSTAFGVIYFHEAVSTIQIFGVVLLLFALLLTIGKSDSNDANEKKASAKWLIWCFLFCLCSGAVGIIFKLHQSSPSRGEVNQMMLAASIVSALLFAVAAFAVSAKDGKKCPRVGRPAWLFVVACGLVSCGYNRLNIVLSGGIPSIIFFPLFNGTLILVASLLAALIFREKITKRQIFGMLTGFAALVLISVG